jgi:thymidylate synthase (FAD)
MQLIRQSALIYPFDPVEIYKKIERAGRLCWKSEGKVTESSYEKFIPMIMSKHHESVLEHGSVTIRFITNRAVTHELVRHRTGVAYSQESTRYCNYSKDKFNNQLTFIIPSWLNLEERFWTADEINSSGFSGEYLTWLNNTINAELGYNKLITEFGWTAQQARGVLTNDLKTEIEVSVNIRELRHILLLRGDAAAHPQMRELMLPVLDEMNLKLPLLFNDIWSAIKEKNSLG